jgi:hypothetical protein
MKFLDTIHVDEINNVHLIERVYGVDSGVDHKTQEVKYGSNRELLFGDGIVNGEISHYIRKYGKTERERYYQLPESRKIDQDYRAAFERALREETWN